MTVSWLNVLLLLIVVPGHVALVVLLLNRAYSFALSCPTLRMVRSAHDVLILAGPPLFVWRAGIAGPSVLLGGAWSDLPAVLLGYTVLCAGITVLAIPVILFARKRRRLPAAQLSNHSHIVDVAEQLGRRPLGHGPQRYLAHVPGNEIYRVEFAEKQYTCPRLPKACDGLSILHVSDVHLIGTLQREFFETVVQQANDLRADLVAVTGDIIDRMHCLDWLSSTLGRLEAPLGRYFILGNHDWFHGDMAPIRRALHDLDYVDLAGRWESIEHAGAAILLAGTERPWFGEHPDTVGAPPEAFRILLSHTPDNFGWAQSENYDIMLAGHLHGGQVLLPVWGPVYSPSRYGARYIAGAYHEGPTLMHVSRGLSGIQPLRIGARPEVTKLVLRAGVA